jgi:hypothetical protein
MTLLITKVGAPQTRTENLKDGSGSFDKTNIPVTLRAKFGEEAGFELGVNYTIWLDVNKSRKVIAIASALIDGTATDKNGELYHPNCRLAVVNDSECFNFGKRKANETYLDSQAIWLKDDVFFTYEIGELSVSPERGNIDDLDILVDFRGTALLASAVVPSDATMDEPF